MDKNMTVGGRLKGAANYLWREGTVYIILAALILMFSFINPLFFSWRNIYNLISESSFLIIAGMGIVFVMISGGMDLSVGYQMAMVSSTSFILMDTFAKANGGDVPGWFVLVTWFVLNKTHFGRDILAVGGNRECARLSGIRADLIQTLCFSLTGSIFGIAALDMMAHQNMTSANSGPGSEFTCLTAAIIGGLSPQGGKGNVVGLVAGIFVMQIISNGMQLAGWGTYLQYAVKGIILLAAIALDALKNRPKPVVRVHKEQEKVKA